MLEWGYKLGPCNSSEVIEQCSEPAVIAPLFFPALICTVPVVEFIYSKLHLKLQICLNPGSILDQYEALVFLCLCALCRYLASKLSLV